jgi:hypothetical protein
VTAIDHLKLRQFTGQHVAELKSQAPVLVRLPAQDTRLVETWLKLLRPVLLQGNEVRRRRSAPRCTYWRRTSTCSSNATARARVWTSLTA